MKVIKRDKREVEYSKDNIKEAIMKATFDVTKDEIKSDSIASEISAVTDIIVNERFKKPTVEEIQDLIEQNLMSHKYYDVAKTYILYREKQKMKREGAWLTGELSNSIWENKYRYGNETPEEFLRRVTNDSNDVAKLIRNKLFCPAGRILANRLLQNDGKKVTYSNCFIKGTNVYTKNGYKPIESISKGEMVLTHKGNFKPVTNTFNRIYNGYLYTIKGYYAFDEVVCTDEHPFFTDSGWKEAKDISSGQRGRKGDYIKVPRILIPRLRKIYDDNHMKVDNKHNDVFDKWIDDELYLRVKEKEKKEVQSVKVYNISVEDDESYIVNGLCVHNCYVNPTPKDEIESIFKTASQLARTFSYGGGSGIDISNLRPKGARVNNAANTTSGSCSFMRLYDITSEIIGQKGRRAALMISLACFAKNTRILTEDGWKTIEYVVENKYSGKVWTHRGFREIEAYQKFKNRRIYRIETDNGKTIEVTGDHEFVVKNIKTNEEYLKEIINIDLSTEELVFYVEFKAQKEMQKSYSKVIKIESIEKDTVYDITVKDVHRILANNFYTSNCSHPDIEDFIDIKNDLNAVTKANISIRTTDDFMKAVKNDKDFELSFYVNDTGELIKKTVSAMRIFNKIAYSNWRMAEPGILFWDRIESWNILSEDGTFKYGGVNPCAEEVLPEGGSCNLASINLSEFVMNPFEGTSYFDMEHFEEVVKQGTKYLNEILDEGMRLHPLHEQRESVRQWRQIGLGIMGLADMFIKMGITYGDKGSINLSKKIGHLMINTTLQQSALLAKENGPYPKYHSEDILKSKFIKKNADGKTYELILKHGLRNSQLTTVAPTGCSDKESLILTQNGLLSLEELNPDISNMKWKDINEDVITQDGISNANKFYANGLADTKVIITKSGTELISTLNHKYRIYDIKSKEIYWKGVKDIRKGDLLIKRMNQYNVNEYQKLHFSKLHDRFKKSNDIIVPKVLDEKLAKLIGYYVADGFPVHKYDVVFATNTKEPHTREFIVSSVKKIFGIDGKIIHDEKNESKIKCSSKQLASFFKQNGFNKKNCYHAFIPKLIRMSPRSVIHSFMSGMYSGDGCIRKDDFRICYKTTSKKLANQIQSLLLSIGIQVCLIKENGGRESTFENNRKVISRDSWNISAVNKENNKKLAHIIDFIQPHKQILTKKCINSEIKLYCNDLIPVYDYNNLTEKGRNVWNSRKYRNQNKLVPRHSFIGSNYFIKNDLILDEVVNIIENNELIETFDISVPQTYTYLLNGVVSHNTISNLFGTSGGIEPIFALSYKRKTKTLHDTEHEYDIFTPIVREYMEKNGIDNVEDLPEYFVTSHDIPYRNRIDLQSAWQQYIDSSISSTVNLPNSATIDDIKKLYMYAWEKGTKGITIYRDGCAREGILTHSNSNGKVKEMTDDDFISLNICPVCKNNLKRVGGCAECPNCGFSVCG